MRTLDFYNEFCGLQPALDTPRDTMVFPLAEAGRLVFKHVDDLGVRTLGHVMYRALHTALSVRDDQFLPILRNLWTELPEWDFDPEDAPTLSKQEAESLAPRTCIHGAPTGPLWKQTLGRGDSFVDWDTNTFHFMGFRPLNGSFLQGDGITQEDYMEQEKALR